MTRGRALPEPTDLPVSFGRPLSLFAYVIGHGQVVFRGEPDPEAGLPTTVELLFKGVNALAVRDHYRALTVRFATAEEEARLRAADPRPWHDRRAFVLEDESGSDGHVVAGAMYWAESDAPPEYSSFLMPEYELPRLRTGSPRPPEPARIRTSR